MEAPAAATVHTLKVALCSVKPPIWPRVAIASDVSLAELSDLLEPAMGWMDGHLHVFDAGGIIYERPDSDGWSFWPSDDEAKHQLGEVLGEVGAKTGIAAGLVDRSGLVSVAAV